jgi:hypothetical protein
MPRQPSGVLWRMGNRIAATPTPRAANTPSALCPRARRSSGNSSAMTTWAIASSVKRKMLAMNWKTTNMTMPRDRPVAAVATV